ncbi:hypothetical protein [Ramlibacter pallidus]|uniref:Lipoprotein n=1 Tax=Ramlibacter pallidus TaxID=2780087 RepID=A0ABR9S999_9BURK|nr:hypothetical protein [Ramlibacter pallidus]MBE7370083.1 hypothetical protein [Ramlibacter pallidus]
MSALQRGAAVVLGCLAAAQAAAEYRNATTGGPLRPGIYGRIVVKHAAPPPPVIYPQPVVADAALPPPGAQPVYLYVPPGQVRKWKQNCARWQACSQPVLFVRVDDSPSRWGSWRHRREQVALQERD